MRSQGEVIGALKIKRVFENFTDIGLVVGFQFSQAVG